MGNRDVCPGLGSKGGVEKGLSQIQNGDKYGVSHWEKVVKELEYNRQKAKEIFDTSSVTGECFVI